MHTTDCTVMAGRLLTLANSTTLERPRDGRGTYSKKRARDKVELKKNDYLLEIFMEENALTVRIHDGFHGDDAVELGAWLAASSSSSTPPLKMNVHSFETRKGVPQRSDGNDRRGDRCVHFFSPRKKRGPFLQNTPVQKLGIRKETRFSLTAARAM